MDKKAYELLREINLYSDSISDQEEIINIFANETRKNRLSQEEVKEMSERMLKEVREEKKIRYEVVEKQIIEFDVYII